VNGGWPTREDVAAFICGGILALAVVAGTMDLARAAGSHARVDTIAADTIRADTTPPRLLQQRLACPVGGCTDYLIATRGDTTWYERQCILPPRLQPYGAAPAPAVRP
jgi:hypothetical protein